MSERLGNGLKLTAESGYLTDAFYADLLRDRDVLLEQGPCTDTALSAECAALLYFEARLLDQKRYEQWLDLYTDDAIYWIPYDDTADVRSHINLVFDDRRRLEDRVLRQKSSHAHAIQPDPNYQHVVSNVEAWQMPDGCRRVLASQVAYEYRYGHEVHRYVYRTDHTLKQHENKWLIAVKRCTLINIDAAFEPPTLL
ncbi:MAG: aromatic-ring-hydroxylating dioxygenase subunit beta [Pseudomonadota bacterium]